MSSQHEDLQRLTRLAVQHLVDNWMSRSWTYRPWGMWLLLWGAIRNGEETEPLESVVPLTEAWFLTSSGFVRREQWDALRQLAVRQAELERQGLAPSTGVGILQVAPYRDLLAVYADCNYGPMNEGGFRMELDDQGQPVYVGIWRS
ncbi:hypothetical protein F0U60_28115 [Archangium minus]|uniref:Uncharacterized protein n=1 Tax=Archangium minus TaxID=83450 RepID=A0ABY9WWR3_9BACT|nr:hypothetical protein F0U60_28115 [Archangium minus]